MRYDGAAKRAVGNDFHGYGVVTRVYPKFCVNVKQRCKTEEIFIMGAAAEAVAPGQHSKRETGGMSRAAAGKPLFN